MSNVDNRPLVERLREMALRFGASESLFGYSCDLEEAVKALEAAQVDASEPIAWSYELATVLADDGSYTGWEGRQRLSFDKPNVPDGSVRNLTPLYALPPGKSLPNAAAEPPSAAREQIADACQAVLKRRDAAAALDSLPIGLTSYRVDKFGNVIGGTGGPAPLYKDGGAGAAKAHTGTTPDSTVAEPSGDDGNVLSRIEYALQAKRTSESALLASAANVIREIRDYVNELNDTLHAEPSEAEVEAALTAWWTDRSWECGGEAEEEHRRDMRAALTAFLRERGKR